MQPAFDAARIFTVTATTVLIASLSSPVLSQGTTQGKGFQIEETTIKDLHRAIQSGQTTCQQVVQTYIARAKAYNGMCTALVTKDGAPVPPAKGPMKTGAQVSFPTETIAVAKVLPDFDRYTGLPIEFGRMETTLSDPTVTQQYGMRVGLPNAGQLNALETINIHI